MLPNPLPTDPEQLESLYREYVSHENVDQAELDRLIRARLRSWGLDPEHITSEQLLVLMEESTNQLLLNLYGVADSAPDSHTRAQLQEIIEQAEQLRGQITQLFESSAKHQT